MTFRSLSEANFSGSRVLVRVDFNLPFENGVISDDTRLKSALPTIDLLRAQGAKVILLAHFDRPKGHVVPEMSLAPIAPALSALIGAPVGFASDTVGSAAQAAVAGLQNGEVLLLENTRFNPGEEANDPAFAVQLAALTPPSPPSPSSS